MPDQITIIDLLKDFQRQSGQTNNQTAKFLLIGTGDSLEADTAMIGYLAEWVTMANGFQLPLNQVNGLQVGEEIWVYTCTWGVWSNNNNLSPVINFDTGGSSAKITQSIQTVGMYSTSDSDPAPNLNGAIGAHADGTVDGVELPAPTRRWNEKHFIPRAQLTQQFYNNVTLLGQRTNAAPFRGYVVDAVKFDHITGTDTGVDPVEITFHFEAGYHLTDFMVGGVQVASKKAWEYLWVRYQTGTPGGKIAAAVPQYVYVEQVCYQGDFTLLPIPQGLTP